MPKQIIYGSDARTALTQGINTVADAVKITIGPKGRNVGCGKGYGWPMFTNDGVSIAKEISVKDPFQDIGVQAMKEVADKMNLVAGDGSTTCILLTQAINSEGLRHIDVGVSSVAIKQGIEKASKDVVGYLKGLSKPVGEGDLAHVASVSAESEEIGSIIADTVKKVGVQGVVTTEEYHIPGITSEISQGLEIDKGYKTPYMITNHERMESECKDVYVLVTDRTISNVKEMLPLLEKIMQQGKKELVIIAEDFEGDALATLILNKLKGNFHALCVRAPGFGERKTELLRDIASVVGATFISKDAAIRLETITLDGRDGTPKFGMADRIYATAEKTVIVGGKGSKEEVAERVAEARKGYEKADSKVDRARFEERIAKMVGGVAIIRVGAPTDTDRTYLKHKVEDAVSATMAAVSEGIIPGGAVSLLRAAYHLQDLFKDKKDEELIGYKILSNALMTPFRQIMKNAGHVDWPVIEEKILQGKDNQSGFNVKTDSYSKDMIKDGIVDPLKVARVAIEYAVSSASTLLTTEVLIAEEPKKDEDKK